MFLFNLVHEDHEANPTSSVFLINSFSNFSLVSLSCVQHHVSGPPALALWGLHLSHCPDKTTVSQCVFGACTKNLVEMKDFM